MNNFYTLTHVLSAYADGPNDGCAVVQHILSAYGEDTYERVCDDLSNLEHFLNAACEVLQALERDGVDLRGLRLPEIV